MLTNVFLPEMLTEQDMTFLGRIVKSYERTLAKLREIYAVEIKEEEIQQEDRKTLEMEIESYCKQQKIVPAAEQKEIVLCACWDIGNASIQTKDHIQNCHDMFVCNVVEYIQYVYKVKLSWLDAIEKVRDFYKKDISKKAAEKFFCDELIVSLETAVKCVSECVRPEVTGESGC